MRNICNLLSRRQYFQTDKWNWTVLRGLCESAALESLKGAVRTLYILITWGLIICNLPILRVRVSCWWAANSQQQVWCFLVMGKPATRVARLSSSVYILLSWRISYMYVLLGLAKLAMSIKDRTSHAEPLVKPIPELFFLHIGIDPSFNTPISFDWPGFVEL